MAKIVRFSEMSAATPTPHPPRPPGPRGAPAANRWRIDKPRRARPQGRGPATRPVQGGVPQGRRASSRLRRGHARSPCGTRRGRETGSRGACSTATRRRHAMSCRTFPRAFACCSRDTPRGWRCARRGSRPRGRVRRGISINPPGSRPERRAARRRWRVWRKRGCKHIRKPHCLLQIAHN